jgi:hypothetical protein
VFELRAYTLSHSTSPFFCDRFFGDRVSRTVCLGWIGIVILLVSASSVARITGISHQCPANAHKFNNLDEMKKIPYKIQSAKAYIRRIKQ